jgi:hypothetical protein
MCFDALFPPPAKREGISRDLNERSLSRERKKKKHLAGTYLQKGSPRKFETQAPLFLQGLGEQEGTAGTEKSTF